MYHTKVLFPVKIYSADNTVVENACQQGDLAWASPQSAQEGAHLHQKCMTTMHFTN